MISICPKCRSYKWNNIVEDNYIICPDCGKRWSFIKKPLYIITGCCTNITEINHRLCSA